MFSIASIDDVIATIAYFAKCNHGKIYGGAVRDYVIPKKYGQSDAANFTDIDIWFDFRRFADAYPEKHTGGVVCLAKRFAEDIQKYTDLVLVATDSVSVGQVALEYGGGFSRYGVYRKSDPVTELFCVDLVVSDYFPVCDFDVNCLTYDGDKIELEQPNIVGSHGKHYDFKLDEFAVIQNILRMDLRVLPTYKVGETFVTELEQYLAYSSTRMSTRLKKFEGRGWKLIHESFDDEE